MGPPSHGARWLKVPLRCRLRSHRILRVRLCLARSLGDLRCLMPRTVSHLRRVSSRTVSQMDGYLLIATAARCSYFCQTKYHEFSTRPRGCNHIARLESGATARACFGGRKSKCSSTAIPVSRDVSYVQTAAESKHTLTMHWDLTRASKFLQSPIRSSSSWTHLVLRQESFSAWSHC
jgi:hypothetical protein